MQRRMLRHILLLALAAEIVNLVTAIGCVHIAESVGSRRELVANSCTHRRRRRDATRQFRRVNVGGVYWALEDINYVCRLRLTDREDTDLPRTRTVLCVMVRAVPFRGQISASEKNSKSGHGSGS